MSNNINANIVNANEVNANQISANEFGGRGAGGAVITASKIILGNWIIEAGSDQGPGLYVTTPDGIKTKMGLIDYRQVPVPATATLAVEPTQTSVASIAVGTGNPGAIPTGNWQNAGTPNTTTSADTPINPVGNQNVNNSPVPVNDGALGPGANPGVGPGYSPLTTAGIATLANHGITDPDFITGLNNLCQQINVPSDNMVIVFQIESNLNPHLHTGSAAGLNQIMPDTAHGLGYTTNQIAAMTATEQITGPTAKYFISNKRILPAAPSMADLYLLNFYPVAVGKPDDYVCGSPKANGTVTDEKPATLIASQNAPFAMGNPVITVGSFKQWLANRWKM